MFSPTLVIPLIALVFIYLVNDIAARRRRNPRRLPLPPGPKPLPFLGNVLQLPQVVPWEGYDTLCKEYGDIIYLKALGQGILVLGSHRRAVDLLDKRAANYSDRPVFPALDMMDFDWNFGMAPYGASWRRHRRTFHQHLNNNAVRKYHPIMAEETKLFLKKIRVSPDQVFDALQFLFGMAIMRTAYGFENIRQNESLIHNVEDFVLRVFEVVVPGRFLVNHLPILRHVPSWFPGAGFKRYLTEYMAHLSYAIRTPPFEEAKQDVANEKRGSYPCMAYSLIDRLPEESDPNRATLEEVARNVCAVAYLGGGETTISSATALLYVLASYPETQTKAQQEIDSVVGPDRLPLVSDREKLPYVHAVVKEVSRWYTVIPLGIAHTNTEDDEYDGYFIPKGTLILQNNWAIMHDLNLFDRPFDFIPERYLKDGKIDPSIPDPDIAAFGYGRRICPGRHFSNDALFQLAASLLATYSITAPKDEEGKMIPMKLELKNPTVSKPRPFKCDIRLRPGRDHLLQ